MQAGLVHAARHSSWVAIDAGNEGMSELLIGGTVVERLEDDGLAASVPSAEDEHDLSCFHNLAHDLKNLRRKQEQNIQFCNSQQWNSHSTAGKSTEWHCPTVATKAKIHTTIRHVPAAMFISCCQTSVQAPIHGGEIFTSNNSRNQHFLHRSDTIPHFNPLALRHPIIPLQFRTFSGRRSLKESQNSAKIYSLSEMCSLSIPMADRKKN